MMLKPGQRLRSTTCEGQFVVVRPPSTEIELTCGGAPVADLTGGAATGTPDAARAGGTLVGKRYGHPDSGLELLCTKAGAGSLAVGAEPLEPVQAKTLPSSD
ncbi:hypothetical protein ACQP04_23760 [Pseudonocardia halophobica]|uniref:hypothetical protein n=1 Tax=Pseudonocardia halophobica TaxID=29401 RepID=UPI003D9212D9